MFKLLVKNDCILEIIKIFRGVETSRGASIKYWIKHRTLRIKFYQFILSFNVQIIKN